MKRAKLLIYIIYRWNLVYYSHIQVIKSKLIHNMFKYQKKNAKTGAKVHLHKSPLQFSPFDMRDSSYLEHLHKELKLRNSREALLSLRKI